MNESLVVRAGIVVYLILVGFAVSLMWRNSGAQDGIRNTGIMLASILPVFIAVLPYFRTEKLERRFTYSLLYDSKTKRLTTGDSGPYDGRYIHMFVNLSKLPGTTSGESFQDFMEDKGLDLIERGIFSVIAMKFATEWDIAQNESKGPGWSSISWGKDKSSPDTGKTTIPKTSLMEIFGHNKTITTPEILPIRSITLPPGSKLSIALNPNGEHRRNIQIENPLCSTTISIHSPSGGVVQRGVWGILPADSKDMNRYYAITFDVILTTNLKFAKVYAPSSPLYRKWHDNLANTLSQFDWAEVDKDTHTFMERKALGSIIEKTGGK